MSVDIIVIFITTYVWHWRVGKGRGVFSSSDIPRGTLIHISPVLLFPAVTAATAVGVGVDEKKWPLLDPYYDTLKNYTYCWSGARQALALGKHTHYFLPRLAKLTKRMAVTLCTVLYFYVHVRLLSVVTVNWMSIQMICLNASMYCYIFWRTRLHVQPQQETECRVHAWRQEQHD